jgi:hypothetical protein
MTNLTTYIFVQTSRIFYRQRERETDRQTDRQTDRETDRQTDRQTNYNFNGTDPKGWSVIYIKYIIILV